MDSASRLLTEYPNSAYLLDHYAAEGMYFTVSSQFKKALESLDKGVALAKKLGLRYEEQRLQLQRFYALYNDKSYGAAKSVVIYLMKQREMMKLATNRLQLYYGMAVADQGMKDMTGAFDWLKRYSELSDSVSQSKFKNDINAMEIKYRNAESQKKNSIILAALQYNTSGLCMANSISHNLLYNPVNGYLSRYRYVFFNAKRLKIYMNIFSHQ